METITAPQVGTVSHGTLRPQDLLPKFLDELLARDMTAYAQLLVSSPFGIIPAHAQEDESAAWWYQEDCHCLLTSLMDALDLCAPEGYYFGSHPGDGSDFGFWEHDD